MQEFWWEHNLKINGLITKPRWYDIKCKCGQETLDKYPIKDCLHCRFEECERSMPKKSFKILEPIIVKGKVTDKKQPRTVNEITIVRGKVYEDIMGWTF